MSKPITLEFNLKFNNDVDSIISLLKLTSSEDGNKIIPVLTDSLRLKNRTWRLLNNSLSKIPLKENIDTFYDLSNNYIPSELLQNQSIDKPSLALTNTSNTLFSHASNLSLNKQSLFSSHSSMSNIDEEDSDSVSDFISDSDEEAANSNSHPVDYVKKVKSKADDKLKDDNKNIFFIANSPSPPKNTKIYDQECNKEDNHVVQNGNDDMSSRIETKSVAPPSLATLGRQGSLFNNTHTHTRTCGYSPSDVSDNDDSSLSSDISEISDTDEDEFQYGQDDVDDEDDSTNQNEMNKEMNINKTEESVRSKGKSDDSEWMSVSSEDDVILEPALKPINFTKRPPPSRQILSDTITLQCNNNESPQAKPRSLLSGLFLNEMAKQHEDDKGKFRISQSMLGPIPDSNRALREKPVLKRSSTTGIITVGQTNEENLDSKIRVQRPSILFQKRYTSMTDILKNYPHFQNKFVQNNILHEDSKSSENANVEEVAIPNEDYNSLAKQKSIVGISNFNVNSDNVVHPDAYGQSVNNSISPRPSSVLSTSLTKYSMASNSSFKNMVSRSSINLTSLFNHKKYYKNNTSNEKFRRSASNSVHSISSGKSQDMRSSQDLRSSQEMKSSQELRSSQELKSSQEFPTTPSQIVKPQLQFLKQNSQELIETEVDLDSGSSDKVNEIKIKSPRSTRKTMIESELSKSLKESISIDYNLGKVPLPKHIISTQPDNSLIAIEDDYSINDYHSKGW